ncbi:MAG: glycine zipper 2TM domain-containing protein, partial [Burkholderiales bacterium]|nr:glycine zipper 2TM domain-containing protein [Burkholderiales bacterium]
RVARAEPRLATQPAALCADCGVVEGVRAVRREGQGTGLGAVAGGVLGGVVGHQLGGGNGKAALTLLGAIGGGLAGNEVEKRQRAETVYEIRVRMDDGTLRTYTRASAPAPGTRVTVDAQGLHVVAARAPASGYLRTSADGAS